MEPVLLDLLEVLEVMEDKDYRGDLETQEFPATLENRAESIRKKI